MIDFGRTDLGHIYRDFAALETSIRLTCVDDENPQVLKGAEVRPVVVERETMLKILCTIVRVGLAK